MCKVRFNYQCFQKEKGLIEEQINCREISSVGVRDEARKDTFIFQTKGDKAIVFGLLNSLFFPNSSLLRSSSYVKSAMTFHSRTSLINKKYKDKPCANLINKSLALLQFIR